MLVLKGVGLALAHKRTLKNRKWTGGILLQIRCCVIIRPELSFAAAAALPSSFV